MSREKVDGYIDITLDAELLEGKAGSATYGEIKAYVKEKTSLSVSTLYIAQMKERFGLKERACYNHGSGEGRVPKCPKEKEEAILDAFKYYNMI